MNHRCIVAAVALAVVQVAAAQALEPVQPTIAIGDRRADEKPVAIETSDQEQMQMLTMRLDSPKEKVEIGAVEIK